MAVNLAMSPDYSGNNRLPERFERKFYIGPKQVGLAYGLLHHVCMKDSEFYSEQINSLYFDTPDLDQYEKSSSGDYRKDKIRIRWYGTEPDSSGMQTVFVELKSRHGFAGTKQRKKLLLPVTVLKPENLWKGIIHPDNLLSIMAEFGHFVPGILVPVVRISYWRHRFTEMSTGQRVSLDSHIHSTMVMHGYGNGEKELELPGAVIEIKGETMELPETLMKLRLLDTDWTRFSKYSDSLDGHTENRGTFGYLSPSGKIVD
ncbi:MAG: VTC domain-containing protein [Dehalococcoidales bacterium]|nr:VTC domain-containing protein [Dehalococcoidales bacterium]